MKPIIWESCYDQSWKGVITDASFAHPAKFSRGLIERIFDHCLECGYLHKGDLVGDCFGGIGTGGITAAYRSIRWVGLELEKKFVSLGRRNFALHTARWKALGAPRPLLLQGDSRQFHLLVHGIVSSPPYAESLKGYADGIDWDKARRNNGDGGEHQRPGQSAHSIYGEAAGQIGRLRSGEVMAVISSPPYAETAVEKHSSGVDMEKNWRTYKASGGGLSLDGYKAMQQRHSQGYGKSDGQIGALKSGKLDGVVASPPYGTREDGSGIARDGDTSLSKGGNKLGRSTLGAVISSPPYAGISTGAGGLNTKPAKHAGQQSGRSASAASQDTDHLYGQTEGQISRLKDGSVEAVVTSPPWENNSEGGLRASKIKFAPTEGKGHYGSPEARAAQLQRDEQKTYGESPGQIGKLKGGDVDGLVTSPPYAECKTHPSLGHPEKEGLVGGDILNRCTTGTRAGDERYGATNGQIGNEKPENYWFAMDKVYRSCFQAIKPGGVIVLVLKNYVKDKKVVPLCEDTVRLLEHIGFVTIERIHAMLKVKTVHNDLFQKEGVTTVKSRASFFRRLAEKKGSPPIDWEEVIICRRPASIVDLSSPGTELQRAAVDARRENDTLTDSESLQTSSEPSVKFAERKS